MTVLALNREQTLFRRRMSRSSAASVAVHVLLLAALLMHHHRQAEMTPTIEIAWLDPAPPAPADPAPADPAVTEARPKSKPTVGSQVEQKFLRRETKAEEAPRPQVDHAVQDRLAARLSSLQRSTPNLAPSTAAVADPDRWRPAAVSPTTAAAAPSELQRSNTPNPRALQRSDAPVRPAPVRLAQVDLSQQARVEAAEAPPGADPAAPAVSGEVADRPVTRRVLPAYPDWATREGIEASVTLHFEVMPDGSIKRGVRVDKTAGFADFDRSAVEALQRWRFAALPSGASDEQWGTITFHFRLRDS